jgi:protein-tyrosine phosphatase
MSQPPTDAQQTAPYRVVLVCMGNICRSPMAEIVLRSSLSELGLDGQAVLVDSAGTGGWHVGGPADPRTAEALAARGYPTAHTARQFQAEWFDERDLVVALDKANERDLRRLMPDEPRAVLRLLGEFDEHGASLEVADPYYGDADDFDAVLDHIERCCAGLADFIREQVSIPHGRC